MSTRDIVFLLTPSLLFAGMAGLSLFYAAEMFPNRQHEQWMQQKDDELVHKIQTGELSPKPEELAVKLRDQRHSRSVIEESLAREHFVQSRFLAFGILYGIALQIYVVFRVKARMSKP